LVIAFAFAAGGTARAASVDDDGRQVIERFHAALLEAMKNAVSLGYDGREKLIAPVVAQTFDLSFMAEKTVGRHWRDFDEATRQRWIELFTQHTTANYAGRFKGYKQEHFDTLGEDVAAHETIVVRTVLTRPQATENVHLNYRMRKTSAGWRIIDIYLNGTVSELALRRSEYSAVIERDGVEKLFAQLEQMISDLKAGAVD
jgi:phospholipid transport system substrate-binding protein